MMKLQTIVTSETFGYGARAVAEDGSTFAEVPANYRTRAAAQAALRGAVRRAEKAAEVQR